MGLKEKKSLPWNPQANTILERIHQVLQDCLTTFFELDNVEIPEEGDESLDPFVIRAWQVLLRSKKENNTNHTHTHDDNLKGVALKRC